MVLVLYSATDPIVLQYYGRELSQGGKDGKSGKSIIKQGVPPKKK